MADDSKQGGVSTPSREVPAVWGNVPQRNKNFTGREELLANLHQQVTGEVTAVLAHAVHGMGGVGKTQLAIEYAHRHMRSYQVVWWIPADQVALVRSSLAALAPRLGLDVPKGRVEDAVSEVLDALRRGEPFDRWLVIFDNADQPEAIRDLMPGGPGHVIVTSRNHRWEHVADVVEVDVFTREESLRFLSHRVPGVSEAESARLADELGDLPLALEQAAALQVESGMSVDEYLELLAKEASRVLAENPPADYPVPVAAAWSLSVARLKEEMPFAWELLRRLAYFGPDPIRRDLLKLNRYVLDPPLQTDLGDPILLGRANRELSRYALARVDNNRKTVQVHRLIQKLIREDMDVPEGRSIRHDVHKLLAAADPDDPDDIDNWDSYAELLSHVVPSDAVACVTGDTEVRRLIRNLFWYLFNVGDLATADELSSEALERWTAQSGSDDPDVLTVAGQRATLLWTRGNYSEALEMRSATLERMREVLGEDHDATLLVTNGYGADLRARGDFERALELDEQTLARHKAVYGEDDPRTFRVANNLALDQALTSDYAAALRTDTRTYEDRLHFYGRDDHPWVVHSLSAMGSDLLHSGKYAQALQIEEQAYNTYAGLVRQRTLPFDHPWVLWQAMDFSVARRKMALVVPALELAQEVYEKYVASFGEMHPETLAAAMNLGNARRVHGSLTQNDELMAQADRQIEATYHRYGEAYGDDHPYAYGSALNLAIVRRRIGDPEGARYLLEDALAGLQRRLGDRHHFSLNCMTALATSLSETGDVERARDLGRLALAGLQDLVGEDHPHTLACASNLAIDLETLGHTEDCEQLRAETLGRYEQVLPPEHFDVADAARGARISLDFEPLYL